MFYFCTINNNANFSFIVRMSREKFPAIALINCNCSRRHSAVSAGSWRHCFRLYCFAMAGLWRDGGGGEERGQLHAQDGDGLRQPGVLGLQQRGLGRAALRVPAGPHRAPGPALALLRLQRDLFHCQGTEQKPWRGGGACWVPQPQSSCQKILAQNQVLILLIFHFCWLLDKWLCYVFTHIHGLSLFGNSLSLFSLLHLSCSHHNAMANSNWERSPWKVLKHYFTEVS